MYTNNTRKTHFGQANKTRTEGFTLVEIMIVIVIIVMLTQLGNIGSLFQNRERSKIEEIAVKIVGAIDEEKVNALLGKTEGGKIVRKRISEITFDNSENKISLTTKVNFADTDETTYDVDSEREKSWSLSGLETYVYACPGTNSTLDIDKVTINFLNENIGFESSPSSSAPNHIVFLLTHVNTAHEIHIDRRTGLTYEIDGRGKDENGEWQITCN